MKKILFGSLAIVFAIALVSFTNTNSDLKQSCTWFIFDDNSLTNPGATGNANGIATNSEALAYQNYKVITLDDLALLCPSTVRLCAICAQHTQTVSGQLKPDFVFGDAIIASINAYFATGGNNPAIVDQPNAIKEKQ